jgi:uncharacterized protein
MAISTKYKRLRRFIEDKGKNGAVIAFSGGVDSSTLAAVCHDVLKDKAVAVTAKSPTYTSEEMDAAIEIAREIGIEHHIIESNEFSNENFLKNPENRCYYCKGGLLGGLQNFAHERGIEVIFEGTNFSELGGHRPGFMAVKEMKNVFSPWAENECTKDEIRAIAKMLGLSFYDKPSSSCLASRIPFGEFITEERLQMVAEAERIIRSATNVRQLRVRDHDGLARIEVGRAEIDLLLAKGKAEVIHEKLRQLGFKFITLDLEGYRTGSMLVKTEAKKESN